jgi:hypothetical protein
MYVVELGRDSYTHSWGYSDLEDARKAYEEMRVHSGYRKRLIERHPGVTVRVLDSVSSGDPGRVIHLR